MDCMSFSRMVAYRSDVLNDSETEEIKQHLQGCAKCQKKLSEYKKLSGILQRHSTLNKVVDNSKCYDEGQLLSFLKNRNSYRLRQEFYHHLAACPACTNQLISLENFLYDLETEGLLSEDKRIRSGPKVILDKLCHQIRDGFQSIIPVFRMPRPFYYLTGAAFILVLLVIVTIYRPYDSKLPFHTRESEIQPEETPLLLLSPANHSTVKTSKLEFRWTRIPGAASYTFLLLNDQGDIIWEEKTTNVQITLPAEILLSPSGTYFWQVEGQFDLGGAIVSDMARFRFTDK